MTEKVEAQQNAREYEPSPGMIEVFDNLKSQLPAEITVHDLAAYINGLCAAYQVSQQDAATICMIVMQNAAKREAEAS